MLLFPSNFKIVFPLFRVMIVSSMFNKSFGFTMLVDG